MTITFRRRFHFDTTTIDHANSVHIEEKSGEKYFVVDRGNDTPYAYPCSTWIMVGAKKEG